MRTTPRAASPRPARRALGVAAVVLALSGCSTASTGQGVAASAGAASKTIRVVAAENFWGSIAAQLGGDHVAVTSLIDSPDADPHAYEPTTADARAVASADVVLSNGLGYDAWASQLTAANPVDRRVDLVVGTIVGAADGANPHRWYDPADVSAVADRLVASYQAVDPADAASFASRRAAFESSGLAAYSAVIADIRARYAGTRIGASESIVAMIAPALGLDLVTPPGFLSAISEGIDPTAADKATVDAQITGRQIAVYVYNSQNATPDIQAQLEAARQQGIPVTSITETMVPVTATWQDWQTAQLVRLRAALAEATGR